MTAKKKHPCHPRKRFRTLDSANSACKYANQAGGIHRQPEACSKCNGWHLGVGSRSNMQMEERAL